MVGPLAERWHATRAATLASGLAAVLACASCTAGLDQRQAATCRIAAAALFDPRSLDVLNQSSIAGSGMRTGGVEITLRSRDGSGPHQIECLFASTPDGGAGDLIDIRADREPLSEARLFMLKRFWIDTPQARTADPLAPERGRNLPVLPVWAAYALQCLLAALPNAAVYALLAATYSLVYGLFGRINLAFGEIAATGGFAALLGAALVGEGRPGPVLVVACLFGVWAAGLHGAVIERLVMWRLRRSSGQQGLVATIGLALFLQEYLRLCSGNQTKYMSSLMSAPLDLVRSESFIVTATPLSLIVFALAGIASLAVLAALRFTAFGRDWRATSDDPIAASLFGVDPQLLSLKTFLLACGLAGLAGASVTVISGSVGMVYTTTLGLKALIAAIVGGIGSVPGAFLGGLAIAAIEAMWSAYFPIVYRDLVIDGLLVAVLVLRPGGLFGYRDLLPRRI